MMAVFSLIIFRGGGSAAESSVVFLAGLLPSLVLSPLAGTLADRFDRKWLMMASEFLSGLAVVALILTPGREWIYPLIALEAGFGTLMMPARQAALVDLVPRSHLTHANAFLGQLSAVIKIGAPMLAGLLLGIVGPRSAMILDVISFAFSVMILSRLPSLPAIKRNQEPATIAGESRASRGAAGVWTVLRESPRLSILFAMAFAVTFIIMGFDVLASILTRDVLHGSEELFGLLIGLVGIGTVIVTTGLMLLKGEQKPWRDALVGLVLLACIPASLALATMMQNPILVQSLAVAGCLIGGLGNGLISVQTGTLLQLTSPPELLGRIGGVFQSTSTAGQLIAIVVTPLLTPALVPVGVYFGIAAVSLVAVALFVALALRGTFNAAPNSALDARAQRREE